MAEDGSRHPKTNSGPNVLAEVNPSSLEEGFGNRLRALRRWHCGDVDLSGGVGWRGDGFSFVNRVAGGERGFLGWSRVVMLTISKNGRRTSFWPGARRGFFCQSQEAALHPSEAEDCRQTEFVIPHGPQRRIRAVTRSPARHPPVRNTGLHEHDARRTAEPASFAVGSVAFFR